MITAPGGVFDAALTRAATGQPAPLIVHDDVGVAHRLDAADWFRVHLPGDRALLQRCAGATLDVGCGPGRLTRVLNRLGHPALGIDISAEAVRLARSWGATALRRDVFASLPGHGRWRHLLLADGNIGIGGDPLRLLRRCRELLGAGGRLHAELAPPGTRSWAGAARIACAGGVASTAFEWAVLSIDDLVAPADAAGLTVLDTWTEGTRWFATLAAA
ncbi:bifunctional 2-polyprenyl-6-hydroxyphenol methylase/3-demethylubiquinol 3-O-methyltransferase UbiG [Actinoplanes sp. TFC3]|uniref:class I SAM-dependent methyltransferase n=1 Tax=Actinoplanes sp. TFC3 TaxID=1710355 RepID=UPI00083516E0|nr:class I SAM-dependent methyltransferase [Actinoplanes sp. TFC3]